jgi:hypothetical protein
LAENTHWNEISALAYLAYLAGTPAKYPAQIQVYMPELAHLVTMIGATGETAVRRILYFIVLDLLENLYAVSPDDDARAQIRELLQDCGKPDTLQAFGLAQPHGMSDFTDWNPNGDKMALDMQENLAKVLTRVMEVGAGSPGALIR